MASQAPINPSLNVRELSTVDENSKRQSLKSPFLALAPEVRDSIYKMVLTTALPEPQNPTDTSQRLQLKQLGRDFLEPTTWYPIKPLPHPAKGLLLTCHQVRKEVIDLFYLENKRKKSFRYELSITILEENTLYPTWLLVPPVPSKLASIVWVDIHNAGFRQSWDYRSGWNISDGWVPSIIWGLFTILNRFLKYWPLFSFGTGDRLLAENAPHLRRKCSPIRELKLLVLNVITPTEAKMQGKPFLPIITRRYDSTARVVGLTHPETVMENIEDYMLNVILREEEAANYSKRVYERVKLIKLCLDGKERCL